MLSPIVLEGGCGSGESGGSRGRGYCVLSLRVGWLTCIGCEDKWLQRPLIKKIIIR